MESPQFEDMPIILNPKGTTTGTTDVLHAHLDTQQLSIGLNDISTGTTDVISREKDQISTNYKCEENLYEQNDLETIANTSNLNSSMNQHLTASQKVNRKKVLQNKKQKEQLSAIMEENIALKKELE